MPSNRVKFTMTQVPLTVGFRGVAYIELDSLARNNIATIFISLHTTRQTNDNVIPNGKHKIILQVH